MRYNAERNIIEISLREFVRSASRRIGRAFDDEAFSMPFSADTPRDSQKTLPEFSIEFTVSEHSFSLTAKPDLLRYGKPFFAKQVSSPARPLKSETAELRARAFIAAYAMLRDKEEKAPAELNYLYLNPETGEENESSELVPFNKLSEFFEKCRRALGIYARPEIERVTKRLPTMKTAKFPYERAREGQNDFIRAVYRNIARATSLFATAPTGTGKTVSALYPAIRALGDGRCDKVFYFTPKATVAAAASECIERFFEDGVLIRAIILTAKERICLSDGECSRPCRYSKSVAEAAMAVYDIGRAVIGREQILEIAKKHAVCPHELSLAYSELCDVIICDFNYLFDPRAYLRRYFDEGGNFAFLVDEAHNLVERARDMFSAEIRTEDIRLVLDSPEIGEHSELLGAARLFLESFTSIANELVKDELREDKDGKISGAAHTKTVPGELYSATASALRASEDSLRRALRAKDSERDARIAVIKKYHYKLRDFYSALARFDESYELFVFADGESLRMKVYCIDTATAISERTARGRCAVFFSATLEPIEYFGSLLGRDRTSEVLSLPSPFASEQLSVSVIDSIGTRYSEREDTLARVSRIIAATVSARRGNYMIFSPSFAYSEALAAAFSRAYPKINVLSQRRDMSPAERREFLDKFREDSKSYLIGFCVMGGIYSEGIDLAGDALIGAVIVGVGLPGLSYERGAIEAYFDEKCESGKLYSYIYPGLNRVLQAAGRVIRREDDRGVIVLIDDRFGDRLYKKSMPSLWRGVKYINDARELRERLDDFWRDIDSERERREE